MTAFDRRRSDLIESGRALIELCPVPQERAEWLEAVRLAPRLDRLGSLADEPARVWPALLTEADRSAANTDGNADPPTEGRQPRVAIVTPDLVGPIRNGGIGTAYTALARALADAGQQVTILFTLGAHSEDGDIDQWVERYAEWGIKFVPMPRPPLPPLYLGPEASYGAYVWLAARQFDVVHFPEWGGLALCSAQAKRLGLAFGHTTLCVGLVALRPSMRVPTSSVARRRGQFRTKSSTTPRVTRSVIDNEDVMVHECLEADALDRFANIGAEVVAGDDHRHPGHAVLGYANGTGNG